MINTKKMLNITAILALNEKHCQFMHILADSLTVYLQPMLFSHSQETPMLDFTNKNVVLTGGSGGIGLIAAEKFLAQGANVVLFALNGDALAEAKQSLGSDKVKTVQGDVTNKADLERLVAEAGKIDTLVCLIGLFIPAPFEEAEESVIDKMFAINVKGTMLTIQAAIPAMNEDSSILLFTSTAHLKPVPMGGALYAANKAALRGLGRALALELLPKKIRVNSICPGAVNTERMAATFPVPQEMRDQMAATVPMKRLAEPEEIAAAMLYLSSSEAGFITGEELIIDGGLVNL
jgi:NAD(P)-dependent dehydrogenase (short-subunit alcohol dehydrogenase family)